MSARDYAILPRIQFGFIDLLRGPAALMVLYSHYFGIYLAARNETFWLKDWVNALFVRPLVIVDQFGQLGVMVFFLISGFIITHVVRAESALRFTIRRMFRIYPAYWLVAAIVIVFGIPGAGFRPEWLRNWADVMRMVTITNYLHAPQHLVLGVAWTLQIEVIFYALVACVAPLIRRVPLQALAVELAFVFLVVGKAHRFGDDWLLFAANVAYLPYLLIGQIIYLHWAGGLKGGSALLLGWMGYFAAVFGIYRIQPDFLQPAESRILCLVLALGLFVWAINYGHRIGLMRVPKFFSDISYSLYLSHGPLGFLLLPMLHSLIGYGYAVAVTILISIIVAAGIHYAVERPCIEWGRRLSNRFKTNPPVSAEA